MTVRGLSFSLVVAILVCCTGRSDCEDAQGVNVVGVGRGLVPPTRLMFGRGYRDPDSRSGNASVPMIPPPPPPEDETGSERQTPPGNEIESALCCAEELRCFSSRHGVS